MLLCIPLLTTSAFADEREDALLDREGPPNAPGLSHRDIAFNYEYTFASAEPVDPVSLQPIARRSFAHAARYLIEGPIVERHWYIGILHDLAAASVPAGDDPSSGGSSFVLGNPEVWVRGMWATKVGLGAGGGIGLVVPVPRSFSEEQSNVVRAIRVVRPWDYPHFLDLTVTARPFFDIRHVVGPVTLQMRQGIDFSIVVRDRADTENRYDLTALASFYLGVKTFDELILGLELHEVYQLTADTSSASCVAPCDEHRAAVSLSPSIRLNLPRVSPALSALLPISTPLRREVASYWGARLHLSAAF